MPGPRIAASPFREEILAEIAAAWARAPEHLPRGLEVCACPVCVDEATLRQLVTTPTRQLSPELIREYSGSAHGVPVNPEDLVAILPRYLELLAEGTAVDHVGVGVDLRRFGDARAAVPPALPAATCALMDRWGRLMLLHRAWLETQSNTEPDENLTDLAEILILGGMPVAQVTAGLTEAFADPQTGAAALLNFLRELGQRFQRNSLGWWAVMQYRQEAAAPLADWLNEMLSDLRVLEIGTDPDLPWELLQTIELALHQAGTITAARIG